MHNFFTIYFHAFETHNLVAHQADKVDVVRRLAIDPLFVFRLAIFFAHLLRRTAFGSHYHFTIHPH